MCNRQNLKFLPDYPPNQAFSFSGCFVRCNGAETSLIAGKNSYCFSGFYCEALVMVPKSIFSAKTSCIVHLLWIFLFSGKCGAAFGLLPRRLLLGFSWEISCFHSSEVSRSWEYWLVGETVTYLWWLDSDEVVSLGGVLGSHEVSSLIDCTSSIRNT